jgi:predicted MPP superfamily phosphohydrolase
LVFAGHTHGGQLCLPGKGALVTNCDLDTARAKGLHRHPAGDPEGAWLHVSAGLGTSPMAPVRFCCRPEATLLTLDAR